MAPHAGLGLLLELSRVAGQKIPSVRTPGRVAIDTEVRLWQIASWLVALFALLPFSRADGLMTLNPVPGVRRRTCHKMAGLTEVLAMATLAAV
ncbi:MAG: hypothetical protein ACUVX8_11790 [Candidatus Zipacnadales bacterium]